MSDKKLEWHKVLESAEELPEGRATTVTANHKGICLIHYNGKFSGLDRRFFSTKLPIRDFLHTIKKTRTT